LIRTRHVFLARHGETDWNLAGRWQGHTDITLNANGRAQARALAERMRSERIAAIATSDLARAHGTARIVAETLGMDVGLVDPDLREQAYGRFEGLTRGECAQRFPDEWARYVADPGSGPPGGESRSVLLERVIAAIHRVTERLAAPALVVTHGGVLRACLAAVPGAASGVPRVIPNGSVFRLSTVAGHVVDVVRLTEQF
jgi:broad specificity phosphatase PhoE